MKVNVMCLTCATLRTPPPHAPAPRASGRPAAAAPGRSERDGRSGRWTPARPLLISRAACRRLRYTPARAEAFTDTGIQRHSSGRGTRAGIQSFS